MEVFIGFLLVFSTIWIIGLLVLIGYGIYNLCVDIKYKFINWNLKRKGHALNKVNY